MSCKRSNVFSQNSNPLFSSSQKSSSRCCGGNSENNTCGREMASSCNNSDGLPTRIYRSNGITSCVFPSFSSGCSSCSNSCGRSTCSNGCSSCLNGCGYGTYSNIGCSFCFGSTSEVSIPINPVGLPFWYAGYYNSGCNCCENDVPCVSANENSRQNTAVGKKQVNQNSSR